MFKKEEIKIEELLRQVEKGNYIIEDPNGIPSKDECNRLLENFLLDVPTTVFGVLGVDGTRTVLSEEVNAFLFFLNRNITLKSRLLTEGFPFDLLQLDNEVRGKFLNTKLNIFTFYPSTSSDIIHNYFNKRYTIEEIDYFKTRGKHVQN